MPRLVTNVHEGQFWVWNADHQGQVIESGAWWDEHIRAAINEAADAQRVALDVGASIGWFTCYMAKHFKRVVAVEAHAGTFALLNQNVLLRGLESVECWNLIAFDHKQAMQPAPWGISQVDQTDMDATPNASSAAWVPTWEGALVEAVALDDILPADLDVALVKVDVQGCDLRALRGLRRLIARCRPRVIFEFEQGPSLWHGDTWEDYLDFFERAGYSEPWHAGSVDWVADPKEGG